MKITFMQTSDAIFYFPILSETSKSVREYCVRNGYSYEQYVGIKRGNMPWQAAYNRVYMLKELVDRGVEGWVFYLDADAFIHDMDFDLKEYLETKNGYAGIFAGYINNISYDINSGGFAINLSHPAGKGLVLDYYSNVISIPEKSFNEAISWEKDLINDQHILYLILQKYVENIGCESSFLFERTNQSYVNNGSFISQHLRSMHTTFSDRLLAITNRISDIGSQKKTDKRWVDGPGIYIPAYHPKLMTGTGIKNDFGICSTDQVGGLLFGPYISLSSGSYVARIFGALKKHSDANEVIISSDVVTERGAVVHSHTETTFKQSLNGILFENRFIIEAAVDLLEVRVILRTPCEICLHAIQILDFQQMKF